MKLLFYESQNFLSFVIVKRDFFTGLRLPGKVITP
jgi:hypothetical protein